MLKMVIFKLIYLVNRSDGQAKIRSTSGYYPFSPQFWHSEWKFFSMADMDVDFIQSIRH